MVGRSRYSGGMQRSIILAGQHVALAKMTEADQAKFCLWLQDEALRRLIDDPRIPSLEDQLQWFKRVRQPDRRFFSLVTKPEGVLIGNCGFVNIDPKKKEAVLRITIGNPDFRGKGLGSEAIALLVRYAVSEAQWKRLTLKVHQTNVRAIRSYEKSGFTVTGEETKEGNTILTMSADLSPPA